MDESRERGLTLLELTVVVFILASLAALTLSVVENSTEQIHFEETRARLELVRRGIAGDPSCALGGQPLISGFVADMGRLPASLQELLESGTLPPWEYFPETGQFAGWRGPYVEALLERDEAGSAFRSFRDGWNNTGPAPLFGWKRFGESTSQPGCFEMQSFGADGREGGTGYGADYPPIDFLLTRHDHQVDVRGLTLVVEVENQRSAELALRLRILHPEDGRFEWLSTWPATDQERDLAPWLSGVVTVPASSITELHFSFALEVNGASVEKWIPWGVRSLVAVDDKSGEVRSFTPPLRVRLVPRAAVPELPRQRWTIAETP